MTTLTLTRSEARSVVREAASKLVMKKDRAAVMKAFEREDRFAYGAWNLDGCSCPLEAAEVAKGARGASGFIFFWDKRMRARSGNFLRRGVVRVAP